jgi:hypothetical protein
MSDDGMDDTLLVEEWILQRNEIYEKLVNIAIEQDIVDAQSAEVIRRAFDFNSDIFNQEKFKAIKSDCLTSKFRDSKNLEKKTDELIIDGLVKHGLLSKLVCVSFKAYLVEVRKTRTNEWWFKSYFALIVDDGLLFGEISDVEAAAYKADFDLNSDIFSTGSLALFKLEYLKSEPYGFGDMKSTEIIEAIVSCGRASSASGENMKIAVKNYDRRNSRRSKRSSVYSAILEHAVEKGAVAKSYRSKIEGAFSFSNVTGIYENSKLNDYRFKYLDVNSVSLEDLDYGIDGQIVGALVDFGAISKKSGDGFLAEIRAKIEDSKLCELARKNQMAEQRVKAAGKKQQSEQAHNPSLLFGKIGHVDGKCPYCSSANIQKRSLVIAGGKSSTVGLGISSSGALGAGVGWSRTELSKSADFKQSDPGFGSMFLVVLVFFLVGLIASGVGWIVDAIFKTDLMLSFGVIGGGIAAFVVFILMHIDSFYNAGEDNKRAWMCLSCGSKF